MADLYLTYSHRFWHEKYQSRKRRLKHLQELDHPAPVVIIENEHRLIREAFSSMMAWVLLYEDTAWEIDIETGRMTVQDTSEAGRLILAMLNLGDDDSPEEESL